MHQLRQVVHDEPWLAFNQQGAEAAFVAMGRGVRRAARWQ